MPRPAPAQVLWELATQEVPHRGFVSPPPPSDNCPEARRLPLAEPAPGCCVQLCGSDHLAARQPPTAAPFCPALPPQGLSKLIGDCLQQDPARRPTAQQAVERLRAL